MGYLTTELSLGEAASKLRNKGVIIYAVGVGAAANQVELETIAGDKTTPSTSVVLTN